MENSIATDLSPIYPESEDAILEDPKPQTELPNQMTNPLGDSMTEAYQAKALETEKIQAQRKQQRMDDIYAATKNLDAWEAHLSPEQKNRKIIKGLMEVQLGYVPKDVDAYEQARHEMAGKFYEGKGGESDEAMMGNITHESSQRQAHEDMHRSLQEFAVVSASTGQSFAEWAIQNEDVRTSSGQRKDSLQKAFESYQHDIHEQFGVATTYAKMTFGILKKKGAASAVDFARRLGKNMTDEEGENYIGLIQRAIADNPDETVEEFAERLGADEDGYIKDALKRVTSLAWQSARSRKAVKNMFADTMRYSGEMVEGAKNIAKVMSMPRTEKTGQDLSGEAGKLKKGNALGVELRTLLNSEYSIIEPVFKSGAMGAVERGVFQIPSAVATTATMMIPYVGLPATFGIVASSERNKYRQRLIASGMDREKARDLAGQMGIISAMPQMILEKLQAGAFLGKFPMFNKLATKITNRFSSKLGRFSGRFGLAGIGETNVEYSQELVSEVVQMLGHSFEEEIPDVQWTGKGGVFDGWAYKYLETAVAVSPLGVMTAVGGVKSDTRALAFANTDARIRGMYGVPKEDNDRIDNATTIQEKIEAVKIAKANADPHSDEAKALVEEEMERQREESKSLANLQRAGLFPVIRADKKNEGVVEIVDPTSGEVLERVDNDPQATAEATIAYMQLQDEVTQAQMDELAGMVEVAMLDVKSAEGDQAVELDLGNVMDVKGLLEMFPEYAERVQSQIERLEQLSDIERIDGGDGGMSRAVYGINIHEHNAEQTKTTNRLFAGTSAMTIVHERGHSAWKRALDAGTTTLQETYDFFKQLDEGLVGKKDRNGDDVRFLPEGTKADDFVKLDEAVAEFSEVMVLQSRKGKKTEMRDAVGRQMSAMVKARKGNAGGFKGFVRAMQEFFAKALARHFFIKQAISKGLIKESDLNEFNAMLQGSTEQETFDAGAKAEAEKLRASMSIGTAKDSTYMDAVNSGDMDTAQAMVDARAKAAGYDSPKVHHGTEQGKIDKIDRPLFLTVSRNEAQAYSELTDVDEFVVISKETSKEARVSIPDRFDGNGVAAFQDYTGKPLVAEYNGNTGEIFYWDGETNGVGDKNIVIISDKLVESGDVVDGIGETKARPKPLVTPFVGSYYISGKFFDAGDSRFKEGDAPSPANLLGERLGSNSKLVSEWKEFLAEGGYDAIKTTSDDARGVDQYVVFSPNQIKSADPVTYDSDGNVIPLSQRFDESRDEISFSIGRASAEDALAPQNEQEQKAFDKASKFKDRNPFLAVAATRLRNKDINRKEFREIVDRVDPFMVKGVEDIPSIDRIAEFLIASKSDKLGLDVEEGSVVELRIDIPTYNASLKADPSNPVYAVTLHEKTNSKDKAGAVLAYHPAAHITNPEFFARPTAKASAKNVGALSIAEGGGKFPLATVRGELVTTDPKDLPSKEELKTWAEVGYNPTRSSEFRDVRNGKIVSGGVESVSIGSRVYVKDPVYQSEDSLGEFGDGNISFSVGDVPAEIEKSKDPLVKHIFLKEDGKFYEKIKDGYVVIEQSLDQFEGMAIMLHQPDGAMAGTVEVDGEQVVAGKGGVYYPVMFGDQGYFWASTRDAAKGMAKSLNAISKRNNGTILMALTSAPIEKMFSSTTMSTGALDLFHTLAKNPKKYGVTKEELNKAIATGSQATLVKETKDEETGEVTTTIKQFPRKLKESDSLAKNLREMKKNLLPDDSIFGQRGAFVKHLASAMADHMKLPTQDAVKKMDAKGKAEYEVKKQQALNIANLLAGDNNLYNLSRIPRGDLAMSSVMQGMADMFAEPLVKTFQSFQKDKKSPSGRVYAVLEMKGEVEAYEVDDHESYPFAIRSTSGEKPIVHILSNSNRWQDVVYAAPNKKNKKDKNEKQPLYDGNTNPVKKADESSIFPPSSGVSMRELIVRKAPEGAESIPLSFSIGDARMNDTIINNAVMRMRDPAGVAIILRAIIENVEALKREVPMVIKAFGKELTLEPIVDARMIGDLRTEAREMRRNAIEEAENEIYDQHGDLLSNEDLTTLKAQPVTEFILAEGGIESTSGAKRRKGDKELQAGEYEEASGLPALYYGGTQSPDQMAQQLHNENVIKDPDVSTMMEAVEKEMVSVSNRKAEMKQAQKKMKQARAKARKDAEEWLNERIAEQERDYSYKARATRALQKLSAIRRALPMELRGKIVGDAKLLSMGDEARLKYLEKTVAKVDKEIDKWVRQHTDKAIAKAYKILGKKKLSPETEKELDAIKTLGKMTELKVNEAMRKLHDKLDNPNITDGEVEAVHLEISELGLYGNQSNMSSAMRVNLLEALNTIIKRGKTIRAVKTEERAKLNVENQNMVIDVVSGGKGKMSRPESARQKEKLRKEINGFLKSSKWSAKTFHGKNLAFEGLLNMISRLDTTSGTYKSRISKKFQEMAHLSTRMNKRLDFQHTDAYNRKMSEIFGLKGTRLTNKINSHFLVADPKGTGINILVYEGDSSTESKSIPLEKAKLIAAGELDITAHGLNARDAEQIKEAYNAKIADPKSKLTSKTTIKWEHEKTGKPEPLVASQGTAISLIMMYRQTDIKKSMIKEGYTDEAMEKLENEFLTDESRQAMEWLSEQYEKNYAVVNAVYRQQHGVDLPKIDFYAPVRRIANAKADDLEVGGSVSNFGSSPTMLMERVSNFNQVDQSVNALTLYNEHMTASNHYVSWADTIRQMRDTFDNKDVKKAIEDYVSPEVYKLLKERIQWMADGGNRKKDKGNILDKMRMAHTFSSLAYDLGITIKQFTSLPAYAFDMGIRNWVKYQTQFFKNPIQNAKTMIDTDYVAIRFKDGYSRDVAEGLKLEGGNSFQNWVMAGMKQGMMFGKVGDIVPVIAGGWAVRQYAYDKARKTMSKKDAMARATLEFEMVTDRSQQAVDMKDLSSYSGGGSIAKLFTMYKTSPRQYYAVAYEALLDAKSGRGSKKDAVRKMLIAHTILPVIFQFISDSWKMIGDEDKELEWEDYLRAMLLGPINGLYIAGEMASPIAAMIAGSDVYEPRLPLYQSGSKLVRAARNYQKRDFWENVHATADAMGQFSPSKITDLTTYYSIISKQQKNLIGRMGLFD